MKIDKNGDLQDFIPDKPIGLTCEHEGCTNKVGKSYIRLLTEPHEGWDDEPIFLCEDHSEDRDLF